MKATEISAECHDNYYGCACTRYCKGNGDNHTTCDRNGDITCVVGECRFFTIKWGKLGQTLRLIESLVSNNNVFFWCQFWQVLACSVSKASVCACL